MSVHGVLQHEAAQSDLDRTAGRVIKLWGAAPLSTPLRVALFTAFLVMLGVLRLWFGGFPQNAYPHDLFIFLDGAWRIINGQRPQVDFNSNLGPLMYLFTAGGFLLTHQAVHAVAVAQTAFSAIIALLTAYIAFRRMPQVPAMLVTLAAVLIEMSPCNTGEEPFFITYAMLYNRVGFGFLAFTLIEATQPPRERYSAPREELIGGVLSGFVVVFLFFLKFTYGIMALVLLLALIPYRAQSRQRLIGFLLGAVVSSLPIFWYLDFHIGAILSNLALGASAKRIVVADASLRVVAYTQVILLLAFLAALSAWIPAAIGHINPIWQSGLRRGWAVAVVSLASLGLLLSNAQFDGLPLAALMCVIVAGEMVSVAQLSESGSRASVATCLVLLGLLVPAANVLFWDSSAFAFAVMRAAGVRSGDDRSIASPVASDFKTSKTFLKGLRTRPYTDYINEGLDLLRNNSSSDDSIVTLDFVNPFPFLLQRRPASGGTTCLHYETTFNEAHHLSPEQLLGDTTVVMWPKTFEEPGLGSGIEKVYADAVRQRFTSVAETPMWRLLRRKPGSLVGAIR
jgi:hypothetical protein